MNPSSFSLLLQMFYDPKAAFTTLKDDTRLWLPLLLVILLSAAMMVWYCASVDLSWFLDQMMAANPTADAAQREMMRKTMSPKALMISSAASYAIGVPIIYALIALFYMLASKFLGSAITFGKWFAFTAWTNVPTLLLLPLMALQIITGHGRLPVEDLNMLTLNYLVFHLPNTHHWAGLLNSFSLPVIWIAVLAYIGLRVWTASSKLACAVTAIMPLVIFYGLWTLKIVIF